MLPKEQELQKYLPQIQKCQLFEHRSLAEIQGLFSKINYRLKHHPRGKLVAQRGEELTDLIVLLQGELSADILDLSGQVLKVESLEAPTLVAAGLLFAHQNYLPVQLTATSEVTLMRIPRDTLLILAGKDPMILKKLLTDSGNKIHFLAEKLRYIKFDTIEMKLANLLLELKTRQNNSLISLPYSINALSEMFGVSRPSLSRSLGELVKEGLIEKQGKSIRILDFEGLQDRCLS